jgi:hypothetical protein
MLSEKNGVDELAVIWPVFKGYLFIHTSMQGLQAIILEDYTE